MTQVHTQPIDLSRLNPDNAAVTAMPSGLAMLYGLVPLRVRGNDLVVAAGHDLPVEAIAHLECRSGLHVIVARAAPTLVERSLAKLYPAPVAVA